MVCPRTRHARLHQPLPKSSGPKTEMLDPISAQTLGRLSCPTGRVRQGAPDRPAPINCRPSQEHYECSRVGPNHVSKGFKPRRSTAASTAGCEPPQPKSPWNLLWRNARGFAFFSHLILSHLNSIQRPDGILQNDSSNPAHRPVPHGAARRAVWCAGTPGVARRCRRPDDAKSGVRYFAACEVTDGLSLE